MRSLSFYRRFWLLLGRLTSALREDTADHELMSTVNSCSRGKLGRCVMFVSPEQDASLYALHVAVHTLHRDEAPRMLSAEVCKGHRRCGEDAGNSRKSAEIGSSTAK